MRNEETLYNMLTCDEIQRLAVKLSGKMAEYDCLWIRSSLSWDEYGYYQKKRIKTQVWLTNCFQTLADRCHK